MPPTSRQQKKRIPKNRRTEEDRNFSESLSIFSESLSKPRLSRSAPPHPCYRSVGRGEGETPPGREIAVTRLQRAVDHRGTSAVAGDRGHPSSTRRRPPGHLCRGGRSRSPPAPSFTVLAFHPPPLGSPAKFSSVKQRNLPSSEKCPAADRACASRGPREPRVRARPTRAASSDRFQNPNEANRRRRRRAAALPPSAMPFDSAPP